MVCPQIKRVHQRGALFLSRPYSWSVLSFIHKECIRNLPLSWWAHLGSNQGPTGYEPVALPAELWAPSLLYVIPRGCQPSSRFSVRSSEFGAIKSWVWGSRFKTTNSELSTPNLLSFKKALQLLGPAGMSQFP